MGIEEENEDKQENVCCEKWKQKLIKSENGRKMLRQGIRILEDGIQKTRDESEALKRELENEQKRAEVESNRAQEERRLRLELENEHDSLKIELTSVLKRLSDIESTKKIEVEHVEGEKVNANEEKRLKELLEKERQATEFERKKMEEMKKLVNTEKKKAVEEKKRADAAKKKAEEEKKHAEAAQKKAEDEKKYADAAKKKAEEERKCTEIERRKFEEEKKRADAERKRAEDEKMNREMLKKKLQQAELERQRAMEGRKHDEAKDSGPALQENMDREKSKVEKKLMEQLKKERQQLKAERRRADEEKSRRETLEKEHSVLMEHLGKKHQQLEAELKRTEEAKTQRETLEREQSVLKEELARVTQCLKAQEGQLNDTKREVERLQMEADVTCMDKRNLPQGKTHGKTAATKPSRRARVGIKNNIQGNFCFNSSSLGKKSPSGPSESEGPNPGISCLLEPSLGGSVEKQVQTSALHSTITSFSDGQLVESQGGVAVISSDSSKMRKHKKNRGLDVSRGSSATAEQVSTQVLELPEGPRIPEGAINCNEKRPFLCKQGSDLNKAQKISSEILTHKQISEALKKQNRPENIVDSIARLFNKKKKTDLMIEEKIIALREALRVEQGAPRDGLSSKVKESKLIHKRKRETVRNLSPEPNFVEAMELNDQKVHESKLEQSTKEDWSGNCSRVHVSNQENESQEDESHVKLQTGNREMPEFVRSRPSCDRAGTRRDKGAGNLVEVVFNEQADTESLFDFDIKKMLQLDNESDEELYVQATESLLSPTMPEMSNMDLEDLAGENFDPFLEETLYDDIDWLTGKNYHTDVPETMKGVCSQLLDGKKPFELDRDADEECYFQDKQILSSHTLPKPYEVLKQLEGHCSNLTCEHAPSQVIVPFTSGGCDIGGFKHDMSQKFDGTAAILDNNLLLHSVGEDDNRGNIDEVKCGKSSGVEMDEYAIESNLSQYPPIDPENNRSNSNTRRNNLGSQSDNEQVNGLEEKTEDQRHRCHSVSCEEQVIEVAKICEAQEKKKFADFWILSSCFQDENNSNSMDALFCPFAEDLLSMDALVTSLLETLHSTISNYHGEQTRTIAFECQNSDISGKADRNIESQNMHQDASAEVNKLDVPVHENRCQLSRLNDTVRALELVAQYLGWDWTYNELIPHLWRMAQPNVPEVLIAAIFMLLGNIGRFGVDYDGHEHRGVEELRCNLSTFLDLHCCMNKGIRQFPFSSQLAAAQSLYELMSVNIKTARSDHTESIPESAGRGKTHLTHLQILRKWYSKLCVEEQLTCPEYLRADISVFTS